MDLLKRRKSQMNVLTAGYMQMSLIVGSTDVL